MDIKRPYDEGTKRPYQDEVIPTTHATTSKQSLLHNAYAHLCIALLFVNYFLAQYDKFILSYFQTSVLADLSLS